MTNISNQADSTADKDSTMHANTEDRLDDVDEIDDEIGETKSAHQRLADFQHYAFMHTSVDLHNALEWRKKYQRILDQNPLRTLSKPLLLLIPAGGFLALVIWAGTTQAFTYKTVVIIGIGAFFLLCALINLAVAVADIRSAPARIVRATARVEDVKATISELEAQADEMQIEVDRIDALVAGGAKERLDSFAKIEAWLAGQHPGLRFHEAVDVLTSENQTK